MWMIFKASALLHAALWVAAIAIVFWIVATAK
jgi:hypothetical protein